MKTKGEVKTSQNFVSILLLAVLIIYLHYTIVEQKQRINVLEDNQIELRDGQKIRIGDIDIMRFCKWMYATQAGEQVGPFYICWTLDDNVTKYTNFTYSLSVEGVK